MSSPSACTAASQLPSQLSFLPNQSARHLLSLCREAAHSCRDATIVSRPDDVLEFFPPLARHPRPSYTTHQAVLQTGSHTQNTSNSPPRRRLQLPAMPLIASKTIITSVSLFHLTIGFFFLTNPHAINDQTLVYVLGESMGMVRPSRYRGETTRNLCADPLSSAARHPRLRRPEPRPRLSRRRLGPLRPLRPHGPVHAGRARLPLLLGRPRSVRRSSLSPSALV